MSAEERVAVRLADELMDVFFDEDPMTATLYSGGTERDALLTDLSQAAETEIHSRLANIVQRATGLDPSTLDDQDQVTREVVIRSAQARIDQIDARAVEFTVTSFPIAPAGSLLLQLPQIPLVSEERANGYLERLKAIPAMLQTAADRHRAGIAAGLLPVRHLAQAAVDHIDRYLALATSTPDADPLRQSTPLNADEATVGRFVAERDRLLAEVVRPGFADYRDAVAADVVPHGRPEDRAGLHWLPNGDELYAVLARGHTTTDHTPEELHQLGLDVAARLTEEYAEIGSRVFGTKDVGEILDRLRTDPALRWTSEEELLDHARATIARAEAAAPEWFGVIPEERCAVEPVPAADAPAAPPAYYMLSTPDGARPGTYFANTYNPTERHRTVSEVIAFHEAVPGHHFQLSIAQGLSDLPLLRRLAPMTAYMEGWGLYTERLADEMGLYSDDLARLGMLTMDSHRAGRLVVDTGLHAKGWSRQQAIDYLRTNTSVPDQDIVSEVDRYLSWPGQALSYMVGRLEILRIRADAERTLGDRFDIRAFHDVVLGGGPLPLTVLATVVDTWQRQAP